MASVTFLLNMVPEQKLPEGSPVAHFMAATGPTGFMKFVKVFELMGALLVMVPRTRCLGLLVLGPIILNILAFHQFVLGDGIVNGMLAGITLPALFLLWVDRAKWKALVG